MTPNPPIVQLRDVDAEIESIPVLHGIRFDLSRGQHTGIVGGNGSGKSTLLALLAGKHWPAPGRGSRTYDFGAGPERDAVAAREHIALLGHELQDSYQARRWNFRVRDVVLSGLTRSDIPKRRVTGAQIAEANALLDSMRLGHLAERRLLDLSRGEQRRVLIARALGFRPSILLLDEPLSGLDAESRAELSAMLARAASDVTIVVAAHRSSELPGFVQQTLTLTAGKLSSSSVTAAGTEDPQSDQAAASVQPVERGETLIELEQAGIWLDGRPVLQDIDWQLIAGDRWLITGANGAGKSTLLRLLHGELRPAVGGSIRWPGLGNPGDVWNLRQQVALVSPELQARYLYPTSVFDAVASGFHASIGTVRKLTPAQAEHTDQLLENFRLGEFRDRLLSSLSYGQRHRTLIARTLATRPRVLLLDEPWEGLDTDITELIGREIDTMMGPDSAIVCVSHVGARGLRLPQTLQLTRGRITRAGDSDAQRENSTSVQPRATDSRPH